MDGLTLDQMIRAALPPAPITSPMLPCTNSDVERIEAFMFELAKSVPQFEQHAPVTHRFQDGVYIREVLMAAGCFVVGNEHLSEHYNFVVSGKATVVMENQIIDAEAGMILRSSIGTRKLLMIHAPMRWITVHENLQNLGYDMDQQSEQFQAELAQLEALLFRPSQTFLKYTAEKAIES